jgi:hypothetical protein
MVVPQVKANEISMDEMDGHIVQQKKYANHMGTLKLSSRHILIHKKKQVKLILVIYFNPIYP